MRRAALVIALTGCDLVFPPGSGPGGQPDAARADGISAVDAGGTHDEDDDDFLDSEDGCPHLATTENLDGDGDGVGDECDPQPGQPSQHRALFASFAGGLDGLVPSAAVALELDDVVIDASGMVTLLLPSDLGDVDLYTHVRFEAVDTGAQIAEVMPLADKHAPDSTFDGVSCRIGRDLGAREEVYLQLHQQLVGGGDTTVDASSTGVALEGFEVDVHFTTRKTTNELRCDVAGFVVNGVAPMAVLGGSLGIGLRNVRVRIPYVFVVGRGS